MVGTKQCYSKPHNCVKVKKSQNGLKTCKSHARSMSHSSSLSRSQSSSHAVTRSPSSLMSSNENYQCMKCGAKFLLLAKDPVRCKQCEYRILVKLSKAPRIYLAR